MADIRLWSKDLITEFLAIYKSHACLWKIKSDEYKNRNLKESSYEKLVKFCKDNGMPQANRDFVVKKIQSLKGSFRKELNKVLDSQRSGKGTDDIYKPNLWYYDLLLFTKDQETPTDSFTNIDEQTEVVTKEIENNSTNNKDRLNATKNVKEQQKNHTNGEEQSVHSEKNEIQNKNSDHTPVRKRKVASSFQAELLKVCANTMKANSKELTEFDAVGINIAKKMAKMDPLQAIYAESIINNVLLRGLLKKLTEETNLCNGCYRRVETPSSIHTYVTSLYNDDEAHVFPNSEAQ
ncbi:unnamed protein product [Parnassius mnemosyne]|uniref:MADF domain-containing protein n=1 Tax=Parnassius mnemosyne TaxID=213953 RepID=A0AAV1KQW6_9NEOP